MDTEEDIKLTQAIQRGKPETDEGPYYHQSWWEAYKGSVKGKLGGLAIGAVVGAVVGLATVGVLAAGGWMAATAATIGLTVAGFAAGGMMYGAHVFSNVGTVTGAVAAAHEKSEERMKHFENGKFSEIKNEIKELKALITGKKSPDKVGAETTTDAKTASDNHGKDDYRTTHCDEHCPPEGRKWVFWKVAAIGLAIGAAVGVLLGVGGVAGELFHHLGFAGETISHAGTIAASTTACGLIGASFGINRDVFRQIFDKTDLMFRGIVKNGNTKENIVSQNITRPSPVRNSEVTVVNYESPIAYPESDTYHRDKVMAAAKDALYKLDPTTAIRQ